METIIITLDNNKKKEYVKGIKLKEIIEQEKDKLTNTVVGALYNNNMIDYEETLTKNGKLYIYDLNTKEGNKIYEKGLLYLFEVSAVEALGKDTQIIVKHSIDKGIYCKVNKPLTTEDITKIKKIMKEKIKENLLDLFSGFNVDTQNININFSVYEEKYRLTKKRDIKREF